MKNLRKMIAGAVCAAMLSGVLPVYDAPVSAGSILFSSDFEDGSLVFSGRGGTETVKITEENAHGGSKALCTFNRSSAWNGPQTMLDKVVEPGTEYFISAAVKASVAATVTMSIQYDGSDGNVHYENVISTQNDGSSWTELKNVRLRFPSDAKMKYLYFESDSATADIYIDDIEITESLDTGIEQLPSLSQHYSDAFTIGTALTPDNLESEQFMQLAQRHFNGSVTIGNQLKPDFVLDRSATLSLAENTGDDTDPQVSLEAAKPLLDYCLENNIPLRGHTLVWHSQTPDWFFREGFSDSGEWVSEEKMTARMENYIKNLMGALAEQYPDLNIYAWDVVNEAWKDDGTPRDPGSNNEKEGLSAWVRIYGDNSFIEKAFTFARKYAPEGTKLFYNDYNEYMEAKTSAILQMAKDLQEKGLIDGIGMQSHLAVNYPSAEQYSAALAKFTSTGLDVQITELDITTNDLTAAGFEKQAQVFSDIMDVIYSYKDKVSSVIFWGITDGNSWRASQCPLLFDSNYKAKPAYYSITDDPSPVVTESGNNITIINTESDEPEQTPKHKMSVKTAMIISLVALIAAALLIVAFIVYRIKHPLPDKKKKRKKKF